MKLVVNCQYCQQEIRTKLYATDRSQLEREKGEFIRLTCDHCSSTADYHVNRIYAIVPKLTLALVVLMAVGTVVVLLLVQFFLIAIEAISFSSAYLIAGLFFLPGFVITAYQQGRRWNASAFNQYKVSESQKRKV